MKAKLLIDGRIFSLQKKGGISLLWARILSGLAHSSLYDLALAIYPGADLNMHFVESRSKWKNQIKVTKFDIPPSDNIHFAKAQCERYRIEHCRAIFGKPDLVLNSYYGACIGGDVGQLVILHDLAHEELTELAAKASTFHVISLKKIALESAAGIVAISMSTRERLSLLYGHQYLSKCRVIYHGHDPAPRLPKERKIVHIGTRSGYKRFDVLANAAEKVLPNSGWKLHVVGGEPEQGFLSNLKASLGDQVIFHPDPTDEFINYQIASASVFVSSSIYEGFGLPLLQALASDTVPIISDIPVYREIAGSHARYFSANHSDKLADQIEMEFGKFGGRYSFGINRDWGQVVNEYIAYIEHLLGEKK